MTRLFDTLASRIIAVFAALTLLVIAAGVAYWSYVTVPLLKRGEQTKVDLLISPYAVILEEALPTAKPADLRRIIDQLMVLQDPRTSQPLLAGIDLQTNGQPALILRNNVPPGTDSFQAEAILFSRETLEPLGVLKIYYNPFFYNDARADARNKLIWAFLVLGAAFTALFWFCAHLLSPLKRLSRRLGDLHPDAPEPVSLGSLWLGREVRTIHHAVNDLITRLNNARIREKADLEAHLNSERTLREQIEAQARSLEKSNSQLSQFAYVASHDLQEPLRTITNFVQIIDKRYGDRLDDQGRQYYAFVLDAARRMRAMIEDLLSYSRVRNRPLERQWVDMSALLKAVEDSLRQLIRETGTVVERHNIPAIWADRFLLEHLFQNLLTNSIRYRSEAPPHIRITVEERPTDWVFSVADNGIGIAPEHHTRIFEIFKRIHVQDRAKGTGIGLAICKEAVEAHGGRIWVESTVGNGATFRFNISKPTTHADQSHEHPSR